MIKELKIKELVGRRAVLAEDGCKIYDLVDKAIHQGDKVILDFSGVSIGASAFFNNSIGKLVQHNENITVVGLVPHLTAILDKVLQYKENNK